MLSTLERIFLLIKNSGKSDYAIKKEIGLTNSIFSEWRAGRSKPSTENIIKLAKYFNVSADYLLCLSDDATPVYLAEEERLANLVKLYNELSDSERETVYEYVCKIISDSGKDPEKVLKK